MTSSKSILFNLTLILIIAGTYWWISKWENSPHHQAAPTFELPLIIEGALNDKTVGLRQLKGRPALINFWASWCTACEQEKESLAHLWKVYGQNKLQIVGIASMDTIDDIVKSGKLKQRQYPVALDKNGKVAQAYGAHALPYSFLLNSQGKVVGSFQGILNNQKLQSLKAQLKRLFQEK